MEEVLQCLSSLASDRVRHFELVKVTNKALNGKAYALVGDIGFHLATCNLSGLLKGGSFKYEDIEKVEKNGRKITLTLVAGASRLVESLELETPCNTRLHKKIMVALGANHILLTHEESEKYNEDVDSTLEDRTLLPFKGYKKVLLNDYFFFVKSTFEHTSFTSKNLSRLQDNKRGISININLREPVQIHFPELPPPQDLYHYSRGFLSECNALEVIKDGFYNKRMNLNNDFAKWLCYHLLLRTEASLVAFFVFRRLYMPPMLDVCQDILIRFDVPLNAEVTTDISLVYNEISNTANSITAVDQYSLWNKEIIQVRVDNLRFNREMYSFLRFQYGIVPSYYKIIKEFVYSVFKLLPQNLVDTRLVGRLKDPTGSTNDKPMDYIYLINMLMFGIGDTHETNERKELINMFNMRLSDFIAMCIDDLLVPGNLSLAILTMYLHHMEDDIYKETLREVTAYLMHFRLKDFSKEYSPKLLDEILESYRDPTKSFDWNRVVFNHYATSRLIEEGFFIYQYAAEMENASGEWNPYINLLNDLIEQYRNDDLVERMCKKFLEIPKPNDPSYLPLMKCLIEIMRRHSSNYKIVVLITSILTNFSFHAKMFKEQMVKNGIVSVLVDNMLSNEEQIVLATLKLMINITKTTEHQDAFISQGVANNFLVLLEKYYQKNTTIIGYSAGVLGQLFNSVHLRLSQDQIEYILEIMLYSFHVGAADPTIMIMIMFCLRKLPKARNIYIKIGNHVIRATIQNIQIYNDDEFLINSLELLINLTARVHNCIAMRKLALLETLDTVAMNDTVVQIANKLKELIMRKTTFLNLEN
ncbi:hypothetical protein BgAZ_102080 [Babesia gibsoni]|uniref:Uncharacterized protein n=1 Tax=Babesia gibsoni TaxID=33632 RepID=A0AAD8PFD8_BABGI|nr:hypothetical protein BgAZ_102080 [Babesia gibsoni]